MDSINGFGKQHFSFDACLFFSLICSLCDFFTLLDMGELTVVTDGTSYCGKNNLCCDVSVGVSE